MNRLYLQIYASFVALALLTTLAGGALAWWARRDASQVPPFFTSVVRLIAERLPAAEAPPRAQQAGLERLARRLRVDAALWDASGKRLATVGSALPATRLGAERASWTRRRAGPPGITVRLDDGRQLTLGLRRHSHGAAGARWLLRFAILAAVMAIGAYPVARRIARRLERLQAGVETFGAGQLSARVSVEGRDEIAEVARSFNEAAARIETLVDTYKRMLSSASHELRSPLTRLRVAVELMGREARPELREEAETDIAELDRLIEDILIAARLDSLDRPERVEPVDLFALVAEEAARVGAVVTGAAVSIEGDPRLLRRLIRNLMENARTHGGDGEIEASVEPVGRGSGALLRVSDRGPGVSEQERARVFEPFYRAEGISEGEDGGAGLGLSLVRDIARRHGGDARCLPRDGGGTVFEVQLRSGDDAPAPRSGGAQSVATGRAI